MRYVLPLLFSLLPLAVAGQNMRYMEDTSCKIIQAGQPKLMGFSGGFNAPQFAQGDLNNDGLKDMVVYEWGDRIVKVFMNRGTSTVARYVYAPEMAVIFPLIRDYLKLEDYNRDGVPDLFHKGTGGFEVWRGAYNAQNQLRFTFYKEIRYNTPGGTVNAYSQGSDIPGIVDVDGDGDLDFFGYDVGVGAIISFYKNCQVEQGLPKDSIRICVPTYCWGRTYQGFLKPFYLNFYNAGSCEPGLPVCKIAGGQEPEKIAAHFGNCILMLDYEGDGDVDLLAGNISFSDLQFIRNGRAQHGGIDSMVSQDTSWQAGGKQLFLPQWPSPFYVDGDGDGKRDILVSPHDHTAGENHKVCHFYKNTGTSAAPIFTYQTDSFFVDGSVDLGTGSFPLLYDYNKDGKPDLFVGSDGYYTGGQFRSRISYFQNSSTGGQPRFSLVTSDFMGLSAQGWAGAAPAIGDLDGDGDDDLVLGHTDGTFSYFSNSAAANLQPVWTLSQPLLKGAAGDTLDAGFYASPYIYDINKDGKPDLLAGNQTGRIVFYQNNPTVGGPGLTLNTVSLGSVEAVPNNLGFGFSSLWIGKLDPAGPEYLYSGNGNGNFMRYTGYQSGNVTAPYNTVDSNWQGIELGARTTLTAADLDGDGKLEIIAGNRLGGLSYLKLGIPQSVPFIPAAAGACMLYPNPAQQEVVIAWNAAFADGSQPLRISILNALGQIVRTSVGTASRGAERISVAEMPSGIYTCRIESGGRQEALKLSVMR